MFQLSPGKSAMSGNDSGMRSRKVAVGALWLYGSQLGTIVLQFGYAAVTSRAVGEAAFGAYSIALTVAALATLIANGGLGQSITRLECVSRELSQGLLTFAVIIGTTAAAALYLTSGFWAMVWSSPDAEPLLKIVALSALVSPCLGLASGVARRLGKFRQLSIAVFASNLAGMTLSLSVLAVHPSAVALILSPVAAQVFQLAACLFLARSLIRKPGSLRPARTHFSFSGKILLSFLLAYVNGNLPRLAASVALGQSFLGQLNRAEVVTSIPLQQLQNAVVQAVYPEFRHDQNSPARAFRVWTDMLGLAAWLVAPIAGFASVLVPAMVPIFFGGGWSLAATLAVPLVLLGAVQLPTVILASGIEALGRFTWIWYTQAMALLVSALGAVVALRSHSWVPVVTAPLVSCFLQHVAHVVVSGRWGYLDGRRLCGLYAGALIAGMAAAATALALKQALFPGHFGSWSRAACGLAVLVFALAIFLARRRLPVIRLLSDYRLLR